MAVSLRTTASQTLSNRTTTAAITIPTVTAGEDLYVLAVSRDHTSGTGKYTCTDNDTGGNTWAEKAISTDRKTTLFWKKATGSTSAKTITIATTVGSVSSGLLVFSGAAAGDPTTNIVLEENASGNEAHASFTPDFDNSYVVLCITQDSNDLAVTSVAAATLGSLSRGFEHLNAGGSDCATTAWGKLQGTKTATGGFTWAQTDGTNDSISFAVKPALTYSLAVTAASISVTGGTVTMTKALKMGVTAASIAVTGGTITMTKALTMPVSAASITVTGGTVTFTFAGSVWTARPLNSYISSFGERVVKKYIDGAWVARSIKKYG